MQRLYSTFANGWAGYGLLALRLACAVYVLSAQATSFLGASVLSIVITCCATCIGCLLVLGCWTPIAGIAAATLELWQAYSCPRNQWAAVLAAVMAASLTVLGPGALSIDARRYGRRRISLDRE
jgi:hypothetical protein